MRKYIVLILALSLLALALPAPAAVGSSSNGSLSVASSTITLEANKTKTAELTREKFYVVFETPYLGPGEYNVTFFFVAGRNATHQVEIATLKEYATTDLAYEKTIKYTSTLGRTATSPFSTNTTFYDIYEVRSEYDVLTYVLQLSAGVRVIVTAELKYYPAQQLEGSKTFILYPGEEKYFVTSQGTGIYGLNMSANGSVRIKVKSSLFTYATVNLDNESKYLVLPLSGNGFFISVESQEYSSNVSVTLSIERIADLSGAGTVTLDVEDGGEAYVGLALSPGMVYSIGLDFDRDGWTAKAEFMLYSGDSYYSIFRTVYAGYESYSTIEKMFVAIDYTDVIILHQDNLLFDVFWVTELYDKGSTFYFGHSDTIPQPFGLGESLLFSVRISAQKIANVSEESLKVNLVVSAKEPETGGLGTFELAPKEMYSGNDFAVYKYTEPPGTVLNVTSSDVSVDIFPGPYEFSAVRSSDGLKAYQVVSTWRPVYVVYSFDSPAIVKVDAVAPTKSNEVLLKPDTIAVIELDGAYGRKIKVTSDVVGAGFTAGVLGEDGRPLRPAFYYAYYTVSFSNIGPDGITLYVASEKVSQKLYLLLENTGDLPVKFTISTTDTSGQTRLYGFILGGLAGVGVGMAVGAVAPILYRKFGRR